MENLEFLKFFSEMKVEHVRRKIKLLRQNYSDYSRRALIIITNNHLVFRHLKRGKLVIHREKYKFWEI